MKTKQHNARTWWNFALNFTGFEIWLTSWNIIFNKNWRYHYDILISTTTCTDLAFNFSTGLRFLNKRKLNPASLWNIRWITSSLNHYHSMWMTKIFTFCSLTKRKTIIKCLTRSCLHLCSSLSSHMVFAYTSPYNLIRVFFFFIVVKNTGLGGSAFLPPLIISCLLSGKRITYPIPLTAL